MIRQGIIDSIKQKNDKGYINRYKIKNMLKKAKKEYDKKLI